MGLDIVCACGEVSFRAGSYGGFGMWRKALASTVDIDLDNMYGFGGYAVWDLDMPFIELLNHSDCEDKLTPEQCEQLVEDFEEYAESFREYIEENHDDEKEYYIAKYDSWHEAVKHSAEDGCPVCGRKCDIIFC